MKMGTRIFFYLLSLIYFWYALDLPEIMKFVKHATFYHHEMGFYGYMIYTYIEIAYLCILTAWLGSTKGTFGRKFMWWYWQVVLLYCFITPVFHIFCPVPLGPGEVQTLEQSLKSVVSGIPWAVWSGWGLYHLAKYPVMPRAEKRFHQIAAAVFYFMPAVRLVRLLGHGLVKLGVYFSL